MLNDKFPNRLRELRSALGLSAEALGALANMSGPTVTRLETGARRLKMDQAERLAKALGVRVTEVLPQSADAGSPGDEKLFRPGTIQFAGPPKAKDKDKAASLQRLMARRLKAARFGWNDSVEQAAEALGISAEELRDREAGRRPLDDAFLCRFAATAGCPLAWIFAGKITDDMAPEMAARIALADPALVSASLSEEDETSEGA